MATTPQQGIMALPETDEATTPQLSLNESYGAAKEGLADANPQYAAMYQEEMSKVMPTLMALSDQELNTLLQLIQYLQDHPEEYTQRVQEMEADGTIEKGALPAEYDENFLAVFGAAILEAQRTNEDTGAAAPAMQPPMQLAKGGIAEAARMVASHGRSGDTMLAHITKDEAALLKKHGGIGTLNPRTGLREYGLWSSVKGAVKSVAGGLGITKALKVVGSAVKSVLSSSIGRIVATVALAAFLGPGALGISGLGLSTTAAMGLASAGVTALSGGSLKDVVKAGVTGAIAGYGAEVLGPAAGKAFNVSNAAGQAAMGAGAAGAGTGLLQGKSIKDAVKDGMTAAAVAGLTTGATRGFDAQNPMTPDKVMDAAKVNPQTGEVANPNTPPAGPQTPPTSQTTPLASSNQAFEQGLAANRNPINGLTMESGTTLNGAPAGPSSVAPPLASSNAAFDQALANSGAGAGAGGQPSSWWDSTKQWYNENISPSGREQQGVADAIDAQHKAENSYKASHPNASAADITKYGEAAFKAATPGVMSNYGPAIAAGLGATALLGGFKSGEQPQMSPAMASAMSGQATRDLMAANPKDYLVQNLPGVQYDEKGNIIGSTPWTPRKPSQVEVGSSSYIPFTLPTYHSPTNSIGSGQIQQPYNTADMYTNLMPPRYAADGGYMQSQPTFPGTPLTMDNGPMTAQMAHPLSMNTPGVAMNTPMGLAKGGIADMAHMLAAQGRNGDTMLAHITPEEARMLEMHGGSGSINPHTGLPEFWGFGNIASMVQSITPKVVPPPTAQQAAGGAGGAAVGFAPVAPAALAEDATQAQKDAYAQQLASYDAQNRTYQAQQAVNARLKAYHDRMAAAKAAQTTPVEAGNQVAQQLNPSLYNADFQARLAAGVRRPQRAGIASLAVGGYPRRTGQISGPGTETSDDIPAMLSDGEFVMTAKAVRGMGKGSRRDGAKKMYALMHHLEKNAARG